MTCKDWQEKMIDLSTAIKAELAKNIVSLKTEYVSALQNDYEGMEEEYESFECFFEDHGDDYINDSLTVWLDSFIGNLTDKKPSTTLSGEELLELFRPYIDLFKHFAELGEPSDDFDEHDDPDFGLLEYVKHQLEELQHSRQT